MRKEVAVNTFIKGLQMDMNPLTVPSDVLTDCLNGTLITYNGNEQALQNDMGNARVETAMLPAGFIPMGTTSLGGVIYIASYNPITQQCQLGSFPSPERNFVLDDIGNGNILTFQELSSFNDPSQTISNPIINVQLLDDNLYNGDKFKIFSEYLQGYLDEGYISGYYENNIDINLYPKYLKLNVVSISDSGEIINIGDDLVWTTPDKDGDEDIDSKIPFYIHRGKIVKENGKVSLDEYRNSVQSNYDVYKAPTSGKLGISAQLEAPNIFQVSYDAIVTDKGNGDKTAQLYFFINWSNNNIGEHKNRVNPIGVYIDDGKDKSQQNIELPIYSENSENSVISEYPNTINNNDYLGFYSVNTFDTTEEYIKYLETWFAKDYCNFKKRANDGSDVQYIMKGPAINYNQSTKDSIVKISLTPGMPYGKLTYLTQTIEIDLEKLGSGIINLTNYQYFNTITESTINWGLEVYPETNKRLESVTFNFYDFKDNDFTSITQLDLEAAHNAKIISSTPNYTETILKQNYNGLNTTQFYYNDSFKKDSVYLLELSLNYSGTIIYYYRILHTSNIFNIMYLKNVSDFTSLNLYDNRENGGIEPIFKVIDIDNQIQLQQDYSIIKEFQEQLGEKNYELEHIAKISSNLNIDVDSGISDIKFIGKAIVDSDNIDNIEIIGDPVSQAEWNSNTKIISQDVDRINATIEIEGSSKIILPYDIEYKQLKVSDLYELSHYRGNFSIYNDRLSISYKQPLISVTFDNTNTILSLEMPDSEKIELRKYNRESHEQYSFDNINDIFEQYCDEHNFDCLFFSIGFQNVLNTESGFNFWDNRFDGNKDDYGGLQFVQMKNSGYYQRYTHNSDNQEVYNLHSVTYNYPKNIYLTMLYSRGQDNQAYISIPDHYSIASALAELHDYKTVVIGDYFGKIGNLYKYNLIPEGYKVYTISEIFYNKNPKVILSSEIPIKVSVPTIKIGPHSYTGNNVPHNLRVEGNIHYNYKKSFEYTILNQDIINSKYDVSLENSYTKDLEGNIVYENIDVNKVWYITDKDSYMATNIQLNDLRFPQVTYKEEIRKSTYTLGLTSTDYGVGDNDLEGNGLMGTQDIQFSNIYETYANRS